MPKQTNSSKTAALVVDSQGIGILDIDCHQSVSPCTALTIKSCYVGIYADRAKFNPNLNNSDVTSGVGGFPNSGTMPDNSYPEKVTELSCFGIYFNNCFLLDILTCG
jgi:hypothetical protein